VIPHPWRTENGKAQLRTPGLQKGKLLKLLLALPLGFLPPPLGLSRSISQEAGVLLGHLSILTSLCKLTLEKGDFLSEALCILASRS
jgi:hypothetical protein